jgi:excisionase family DNA binding protein
MPRPTFRSLLDEFIAQLAERVAARLSEQGSSSVDNMAEWLDSRHAAEYLGVHRDTLRKLAAERSIPSEQDGPGCKLYFRRADLDTWRLGGGGPRHLALAA